MKGLDLSKFKKMKEDKDWATLIHKDGHTLNIAKAPLSHLQRKQLEKLAMHSYAEGGKIEKVPHYDDGTADVESPSQFGGGPAIASNSDQPGSPQVEAQGPPDPTPQSQMQDQAAAAPPQGAVSPPSNPLSKSLANQLPGIQEEKAANLEAAGVQQKQGQAQAQAYANTADTLENLPTQEDVIKSYNQQDQNLAKAYSDQTIDPRHYWQDHSKVAAGIGIVLSGIGQAIGAGQVRGNGALDAINRGIDRDIDAQKENKNQALTLWQMNRQALGNDLAANLATKKQLLIATQYQIAKTASDAKGPAELANAHKANSLLDQQIGGINFKLSLMNPTSNNPDPASAIQFLVPEGRQQKVVDEINAAKNTVANAPGILEAFDQATKELRPFTGGLSGTSPTAFIPFTKSPAQKALQARLGPTFQDIEGTVRQAAMDNLDHNITPQFGDDDSTIASKRQSLIDYLRSKSAAAASKSFGIDLPKYQSTNTTTIGRIPQPEIKTVNGIQYRRGPDGKAVRVR